MKQSLLHKLKDTLAGNGLKVTHQRLVIFETIDGASNHPSAEQIYDKIRMKNPSISLGTIYKTLEVFVEKGLINRVNTPKGNMRYDGIMENHNHLYCLNTNEILDFKDEKLSEIISDYLKSKKINNFNIKDIRLHITGEKIDIDKKVNFDNN